MKCNTFTGDVVVVHFNFLGEYMNTGIIGGVQLPQIKAGQKSTLINREKGNMPQEFGKLRPLKITHSPTMTP